MAPTLEQVELAERTLDFIKQHRRNWDQRVVLCFGGLYYGLGEGEMERGGPPLSGEPFEAFLAAPTADKATGCGTTGCFAGWMAILDGQHLGGNETVVINPGTGKEYFEGILGWGTRRLGIEPFDGDFFTNHLFADHTTMWDLERHVADMRTAYEAELAGVDG